MKKAKSVVFAVCIAAALTGSQTFVSPTVVQAAETLLPNMSSTAYNGGNIFTQCGYKGECTWFTYGRTYEKLGIKLPREFYGNAIDWWYANAKDKVFNYGTEPRANSIIVWYGGPKSHGHVGFVEKVVGDTVYFNEGNFSIRGNYDGRLKSMSKEEIKNRGNIFLKGYIYVGEKATGTSPETPSSGTGETSSSSTGYVKLSNPHSGLNVRSSNSSSSYIIGALSNNSKVSIVGKAGDWYKISYGSSYGYVSANYITSQAGTSSNGSGSSTSSGGGSVASTAKYGTVKLNNSGSSLNMRSGASTGSSVIASLSHGTKIEILENCGEWYKAKSGSTTGYVSKAYIAADETNAGSGTSSSTGVKTVTLNDSSSTLNMRVSPWYGKVIASLRNGTQVEVLSTEGRWLKVKAGSQTGYVHSDYVK